MPRIRRIQIKNFRSIHNLDISIPDLAVLVGDNDCGKSNILRALNLFFNGKTNPGVEFDFRNDYNRYATSSANKAPQVEIILELELPPNYHGNNGKYIKWKKTWRVQGEHKNAYRGFNLIENTRGSNFRRNEVEISSRSNVHALLSKIEFEYVPAIRSAEFFKELRGRIYKVISQVAETGMRETSSDFEGAIAGYVSDLIDDISSQLDDDTQISMPNDLSNIFEQLDFLYSDKKISLDSRGDGIKARYIPLILKFIASQKRALGVRGAPPPTFIWAYEEPENNLEFRRAQELADTFCKLATDNLTQILLTTHSPIFYNIANDECNTKCAVQVTHIDGARGTQAKKVDNNSLELDHTMGVMSIIAPHIRQAQDEVDALISQTRDLNEKLAELNPDNLPTIFIEGPTEYKLFSELLTRFGGTINDQVFLAQPPNRAGANYVTNMLRSWEYRMRHQPVADRVKAVGIVDRDDEGNGALDRFKKEIAKTNHTACIQLSIPRHLENATGLGLEAIICLEQLCPPEIWRHALDEGWLNDQNSSKQLSSALTGRMIDNGETIENIFNDDEKLFIMHSPNEEYKTAWINYLLSLNDDELSQYMEEHLKLLHEAAKKAGVVE